VAWSPDGQHIAAGSAGKTERLDATTGKLASSYGEPGSLTFAVAWSPDGAYLAIGHDGGLVEIWSVDGHHVYSYVGHQKRCMRWPGHQMGGASPLVMLRAWWRSGMY